MSWRGTLILLLLAVVALGYFLFSGRTRTHPPEEPLLGIDPTVASEIKIQEGSSLTSLIRTNGLWMIQNNPQDSSKGTTNQMDRANPQFVNSLLQTAADIVPLDILRSGDMTGNVTLDSLGLKKPNRSIIIRAGKKQALLIGVEGAAPDSLYARLDSGNTVYLISSEIAALAFRPAQEYRDLRLTALSSDHLDEASITKGEAMQQLRIKRDQKTTRGWLLETPVSAMADDQAVTTWLDTLVGAKIIHWMQEETDSGCGLDTPAALITLHEEGSANPLVLTIGAPAPDTPGGYFVRCSDRPGICVVSGIGNALAITPQSLRSKKINPVEYDTVDRIEIRQAASPLIMTRKTGGEDWESTSRGTVSGEQMKQWYDRLQGLSATGFEAATPEHLDQRGLGTSVQDGLSTTNHPLTIRLIATLSENTAQENKGETVLAEYDFGTATNNVVALRESDASDLLILPANSVEFLKNFPAQSAKP